MSLAAAIGVGLAGPCERQQCRSSLAVSKKEVATRRHVSGDAT
jgi:hypothetical protein